MGYSIYQHYEIDAVVLKLPKSMLPKMVENAVSTFSFCLFLLLFKRCSLFQVETIGDAYMVVGGLPNSCNDHAEKVANMACSMLDVVTQVYSPVDSEPIKVCYLK